MTRATAIIRLRNAVWGCGPGRGTLRLRSRPVRKPADEGNDIGGLPNSGPARTRIVRSEGLPGNGWTGRREGLVGSHRRVINRNDGSLQFRPGSAGFAFPSSADMCTAKAHLFSEP